VPEADYFRLFAPETHFGRHEDKIKPKIYQEDQQGFEKERQLFYASFEQDAFARSLMGPLMHAEKGDYKKQFSPLFDSTFSTMCQRCNVKQYFGLNDCGNIIIHVDHIAEEHGEAMLMKKKYKSMFKDVPVGEEMVEDKRFHMTWPELIQMLFDFMKRRITGSNCCH
jgi:hypothetical protein